MAFGLTYEISNLTLYFRSLDRFQGYFYYRICQTFTLQKDSGLVRKARMDSVSGRACLETKG